MSRAEFRKAIERSVRSAKDAQHEESIQYCQNAADQEDERAFQEMTAASKRATELVYPLSHILVDAVDPEDIISMCDRFSESIKGEPGLAGTLARTYASSIKSYFEEQLADSDPSP